MQTWQLSSSEGPWPSSGCSLHRAMATSDTHPASILASMLLSFPSGFQAPAQHCAILILWSEFTNQCESFSEPQPHYFSFGSLITFSGHIWWLVMKKKKAMVWWKYKTPTLFPILLHIQCILVCTWGLGFRDFLLACLPGGLKWTQGHITALNEH